jgi:hypothetical protein
MNGASGAICLAAKSSITGVTLGHTVEHWTDGDLLDAAWGSRISQFRKWSAPNGAGASALWVHEELS